MLVSDTIMRQWTYVRRSLVHCRISKSSLNSIIVFEHSKIAFSTFVIVTTAINMTHLKIKTTSLMIPPLYSWWAVWRKSNPDLEPVLISVSLPAHYIPKQSKCTGCLFLLIRPLMPSCSLRAIAWANTNYIPKAASSVPLSCKSRG